MKDKNYKQLLKWLLKIFLILSCNPALKEYYKDNKIIIAPLDSQPLITISKNGIKIPISNIIRKISANPSPLKDAIIDTTLLSSFINKLSRMNAIRGIYHIGFCYKVNSQAEERQRIRRGISKTIWSMAEVKSQDESLWIFIGNGKDWDRPCIELLPTEKTIDLYKNYWLPHIHIDLALTLTYEILEKLIHELFKGDRRVIVTVAENENAHKARIWLGIISGINICLDFDIPSYR